MPMFKVKVKHVVSAVMEVEIEADSESEAEPLAVADAKQEQGSLQLGEGYHLWKLTGEKFEVEKIDRSQE